MPNFDMPVENPILYQTRYEQLQEPYDYKGPTYLENPDYDIFGVPVTCDDVYFLYGDHIVLAENLERYFEDYLKAEMYTKK